MSRFDGGWYKIDRKMFRPIKQENDFYGDCVLQMLWIILIGWSNVRDSKTRTGRDRRIVKRGQVVTSQKDLAKYLGVTRQAVRTRLDYLVETDRILVDSDSIGTFITILNYEKYQEKNGSTDHEVKPDQSKEKKTNYKYSPEDAELATKWVSHCMEFSPGRKKPPTIEKFADSIRKIRKRYEKMDRPGALEAVFAWICQSDFWPKLCTSPESLNVKSKSDPESTRMIQVMRQMQQQWKKSNSFRDAATMIDNGEYRCPV